MADGGSGGSTGDGQADTIEVTVACGDCRSTGLYRGMAEPKGVAVICLTCGGTGGRVLALKPFTGRSIREDVTTVHRSRGRSIVFGVGPDQSTAPMSYQEFLNRVPAVPQKG